jgi:L-gulonolactone oxidase
MVHRVTGTPSADNSGIYRRPRIALRLHRVEDIAKILQTAKSYPSPVRAVGADYSQTRCVGGDGGTTVETRGLDKILQFDDQFVRVQAGVRVGYLVRALAERGLELPLTPEIGNISVGTLAVATLPQASPHEGLAQMGSCVAKMKLISPQGKPISVDERQRDLMCILRSSFGLLGIVHEVVLRVRPMRAVKIDYQRFSLAEFRERYTEILNAPGALRLHVTPFGDRITVERRTPSEDSSTSRSGIWQIRNSVMQNVLPAFGSSVGSVLAGLGLRRAARGVVMFAHEWMRDLPPESWKVRHTYSLWAFPAATYPGLLAHYFAFCRAYHKQHRYRCNLVTAASRLHMDRGSLFGPSYGGPVVTLEPSSRGDAGWDDFLIDFNEFASAHGGIPTFNQTRGLQAGHIVTAFGERVRLFRALCRRADPLNRLRCSYFANLLG